jgi:hypothetical protein
LLVLLLVLVQQPTVKKLVVSAHHRILKAAAIVLVRVVLLDSLAVLDSMLVELVELHLMNHPASQHRVLADSLVM